MPCYITLLKSEQVDHIRRTKESNINKTEPISMLNTISVYLVIGTLKDYIHPKQEIPYGLVDSESKCSY